jgi:hypothetical protein
MLASAAADVDAKFIREGLQPALEGADNGRCDSGGMPVHAHDCTERLEPKGMRQPLKEFVAPVMMDDCLSDDGAEQRHACRQPRRHASAVQRKNCSAGAPCHSICKSKFVEAYHAGVPGADPLRIVRNVMEYLGAATAELLCSHISREAPDIM